MNRSLINFPCDRHYEPRESNFHIGLGRIAHYEDIKSNTFFSQLLNLKQKGLVGQHIEDFQKLNIRVTDITEEHRIDLFIGTLKDSIQHEVCILEPDSLEKGFRLSRRNECKIMATRKPTTHFHKEGSVATHRFPQPTRLTPQKLEEKRAKGLCYSCDSKYTKGHKCVEKKLFYIDCEEEEENEQEEDIHQEPTQEEEEMSPTISCNALVGITTQTLKI